MKCRAAVALVATAAFACAPAPRAASQQPGGSAAFVNVTVIPMDADRILEDHTVIVRNGTIVEMGPAARVRPPSGATIIDGRGKLLMPGLGEMHSHIPGANASPELMRDIMFLYVANGVTTIRGMLGAPNQLTLREQTASGEILGPTILVGAPSLNGQSAPTPEVAASLVRQHKEAGYDFLKLHPGLTRPVYDAIVEAARSAGIGFAGHVSAAVGLERTLEARQSTIDHLDGYLEAATPPAMQERLRSGSVGLGEILYAADPRRVQYWAGRTREAGTWNVPTVFLWETFYDPLEEGEVSAQRSEMRYASPQMVSGWVQQKRNMARAQRAQSIHGQTALFYLEKRRQVLRALVDSGARLLLGADSPQMFNVPGFSLHREANEWQRNHIKTFHILSAGTRNVAEYVAGDLKLDGRFGTVAIGNRADLVLLNADPLLDVNNLSKRSGVMVRGRWLSTAELERGLEEIARRYRPTQ